MRNEPFYDKPLPIKAPLNIAPTKALSPVAFFFQNFTVY